MLQVTQNYKNGELKVDEVPVPGLQDGGVLVRNRASLISAGTEKMIINLAKKGLAGKAKERPDLVKQVLDKVKKEGLLPTFRKVMAKLDQPMALGYSAAGEVVAVGRGAEEFSVGNFVACAGMGYASHGEYIFVPKNLCVPIPEGVNFEDASYVTLGAIAMQGIRQADIRVGDVVAVIGLGLLGQLTAQIAKAAGCRVIGMDIDPVRIKEAQSFGIDMALKSDGTVSDKIMSFTGGNGVDSVIITAASKSNAPVTLAAEIARDRATVTAVGAVSLDIPRNIYYEKELDLRLSRSYGPGRYDPVYEEKGIDYPIGYVRWTEKRNMESFLDLVKSGAVNTSAMTSHRFKIDKAEDAYELVMNGSGYLGIVLEYNSNAPKESTLVLSEQKNKKSDCAVIGFVGAGNFAQAILLPGLKSAKGAELAGLADAQGMVAKQAANKFGFKYATSEFEDLLKDETINAIIVATRHNSHAEMVMKGLDSNKHVFVEKPLAMNKEELSAIIKKRQNGNSMVTVGFNRRFSEHTEFIKKQFSGISEKMCVSYRINAGFIPRDSWVQDPDIGGGRIIGEVCHFIDLISFIVESQPQRVYASSISGKGNSINEDNISIVINFEDGSTGNIQYYANGDSSLEKERIEIFSGGAYGLIDDFSRSLFSRNGKKQKFKSSSGQDKGHRKELKEFVRAVHSGGKSPVPFAESVSATITSFLVFNSLGSGKVELLRDFFVE